MFTRVVRHVVRDIGEVAAHFAALPAPVVAIFDVDNTLAPQGAPLDEFGRVVNDIINRFEAIPSITRVIVLTNGPQRDVPRMISRGNKPWTTRGRLGLRGVGGGIFVIGDQVLTDGVLAWRFGATFLHLVIDDSTEPASQARMRRVGSWVTNLLFRDPEDELRRTIDPPSA